MRLEEIRILDLSRLLPGPYGTQLLADLGAEVIKIEDPEVGDYARYGDPTTEDGVTPTFDVINRGKKSVTLNLKTEAGREAFHRLASTADVVFEQFRPGVVDRLGVGYDDVVAHNPAIVYCSLSGYGQTGPYRDQVGHDLNYVGFAGLLDMTSPDPSAAPTIPGYPIADMAGGLFAAFSIVCALLSRELGHGGAYLDVSMTEAVMSLSQIVSAAACFGADPRPGETRLTGGVPWYDTYATADGRYVTLAALEPKFWEAFCAAIDREDLVEAHGSDDPSVLDAVREELSATFADRTQADWEAALGDQDVMFGVVRTPREMLADPHVDARGTVVKPDGMLPRIPLPVRTAREPGREERPAPAIGEHTEAVLAGAGYSDDDLAALRDADAI